MARESDAVELQAFLFEDVDPNVRRRSVAEVLTIIRDRIFHIVRLKDTSAIVAACYIDSSGEAEPREWEIGGAYVSPEHRGTGIFRVLGVTALVNHLATNRPSTGVLEPIIGHVVTTNAKPRRVLEALGFTIRDANQRYRPEDIPGLEHMPADAGGFVYADTYVLPPARYPEIIREVADYAGVLIGSDGITRGLEVQVSSLERDTLVALASEVMSDLPGEAP